MLDFSAKTPAEHILLLFFSDQIHLGKPNDFSGESIQTEKIKKSNTFRKTTTKVKENPVKQLRKGKREKLKKKTR